MTPMTQAIRSGFSRMRIELRQQLTDPQALANNFTMPIMGLVILFLIRGGTYGGSDGPSLGGVGLPGLLAVIICYLSFFMMALSMSTDREDGTLLRAKTTPNGIVAYYVAKLGLNATTAIIQVAIITVAGFLLLPDVAVSRPADIAVMVWVVILGLLAAIPLGAMAGAIIGDPRTLMFGSFPLMVLIGVSGIFYPVTALPGWLQAIAQFFPFYWVGLGLRSAMLPDSAVAIEIGQSWRHLETAAVLGAWAVIGMLVAPVILRRMTRRESGATLEAGRNRALQRAY